MATIIKIKGADFSGKGLPVITDLVTDGLKLAYRFKDSFSKSLNLSTEKLILNGSPVFTEHSVICDNANKLMTENLTDKGSITMIVSCRVKSVDGELKPYLFGSYPDNKGFTFFGGGLNTMLAATFYATDKSTGARLQQAGVPGIPIHVNNDVSEWDIIVVRFDMTSNTYSNFTAKRGNWMKLAGDQKFSLIDNANGSKICIGSMKNTTSWKGQVEIAEVLIYDKALNDEQIAKQIEASVKYLNSTGIVL